MSVYEEMSLVDSKYFLSEINWSPRVYSHKQQPNQEKKLRKCRPQMEHWFGGWGIQQTSTQTVRSGEAGMGKFGTL